MNMAAKITRWLIRFYLYSRLFAEKITRSGGFAQDTAVRVNRITDTSNSSLKSCLHHYHVKQFHESSCSVATVASAVNALLACLGKPSTPPVTQAGLLERVRAAHWKERMSEEGYKGKRGLPLSVLGEVVKKSLEVYGIDCRCLDIVPAVPGGDGMASFKAGLKKRLRRFEEKGDGLIIAHFNQGRFLPELHIPHISPVGAFDQTTDRVTVLDVDPDQKDPYQVSFDTFCTGLSCNYNHIFKPFGYSGGGYIWIQI
jgi:hypothetical protein